MGGDRKFPAELAWDVATEIRTYFEGCVDRLIFAGSLRRRKKEVGDLEVVFIPRVVEESDPGDMFGATHPVDVTEAVIADLLARGVLTKRLTVEGYETWGPRNKYAVHVATGLPVDLFATPVESYVNYLVCRTGGADNNTAICNGAIARGLKWCPINAGFIRGRGKWDDTPDRDRITVRTERDVFTFAGLEYKEPWER